MILEELAEKVGIVIADAHSDLLDGEVGCQQKLARVLHTELFDVCDGRHSDGLAKKNVKARAAEVFHSGKLGYRELFGIIFVYVTNGSPKRILRLFFL